MLKAEIIEWIMRTFGKSRPGDYFEMTDTITDKLEGNIKARIQELNFVFQRTKNEPHEVTEKDIRSWKAKLDKITGNSIRKFQVGSENLYSKASALDIHEGAAPDQLVVGKSLMLTVNIFHKSLIDVTQRIPNDRRH